MGADSLGFCWGREGRGLGSTKRQQQQCRDLGRGAWRHLGLGSTFWSISFRARQREQAEPAALEVFLQVFFVDVGEVMQVISYVGWKLELWIFAASQKITALFMRKCRGSKIYYRKAGSLLKRFHLCLKRMHLT